MSSTVPVWLAVTTMFDLFPRRRRRRRALATKPSGQRGHLGRMFAHHAFDDTLSNGAKVISHRPSHPVPSAP